MLIAALALIGASISLYAALAQRWLERNHEYVPICDVSGLIDCSSALKSRYSRVLGLSNATLGTVGYLALSLMAITDTGAMVRISTAIALAVSVALTAILVTRIRKVCLVCALTTALNVALFALAWQ